MLYFASGMELRKPQPGDPRCALPHPTPYQAAASTAMLLVDPYNDFLNEGGTLWLRVKEIAEEVHLLDHLPPS
jgi:hypothetical protein